MRASGRTGERHRAVGLPREVPQVERVERALRAPRARSRPQGGVHEPGIPHLGERGPEDHGLEHDHARRRIQDAGVSSRRARSLHAQRQGRRDRARPGESLLDALRERCGITSIKDGCQPQGQCGCCLALVDGRPHVTCAVRGRAGRGPRGPDARGRRAAASARSSRRALRRRRRRPVRLLHPRDRAARQAPPRPDRRTRAATRSPARSTATSAAAPAT